MIQQRAVIETLYQIMDAEKAVQNLYRSAGEPYDREYGAVMGLARQLSERFTAWAVFNEISLDEELEETQ